MPFMQSRGGDGTLESRNRGDGALEAIGKGEAHKRLIAVAILTDWEKEGRTQAVVVRPYSYLSRINHMDVMVDVPAGFVTDFASIPAFAQFLIQPFGRHAPAAVIHDFLYAIGTPKARKYADLLFLHAMRDAGVPAFRRRLMYAAVKLGGWRGYGRPKDWAFVSPDDGRDLEQPPVDRNALQAWASELLERKGRRRKGPQVQETAAA